MASTHTSPFTGAFDVVPLIAGALLHERTHWRETAACHIKELVRAIGGDGQMHLRPRVPWNALGQELRETVDNLSTALTGDFYPTCEGCGRMVYPDDIRIPCTDVDLHADCTGRGAVKAGDHIPMEREAVEIEDGETFPGYVVAYAAGHLFTDEQILETLTDGVRVLDARRRVA